jgi:hypothetical protein
MATFTDLLFEILSLIAENDESTYRAMLTIRPFAIKLKPMDMIDFRCMFGHTVEIKTFWSGNLSPVSTNKHSNVQIIWRRNGKIHRKDGFAMESTSLILDEYGCMKDGVITRIDKPAIIQRCGSSYTYHYKVAGMRQGPGIFYERDTIPTFD